MSCNSVRVVSRWAPEGWLLEGTPKSWERASHRMTCLCMTMRTDLVSKQITSMLTAITHAYGSFIPCLNWQLYFCSCRRKSCIESSKGIKSSLLANNIRPRLFPLRKCPGRLGLQQRWLCTGSAADRKGPLQGPLFIQTIQEVKRACSPYVEAKYQRHLELGRKGVELPTLSETAFGRAARCPLPS